MSTEAAAGQLLELLAARADKDFARGMQRYFPHEIAALGVSNAAVVALAGNHLRAHPELTAADRLALTEEILARAVHHEEVLLGFALLHKAAKRDLGPELLDHCLDWLERRVTNWAHCDDLCLKLLYPFFLGHLDLIPLTRRWTGSPSGWARRAANVAVVKFVRRKVGRTVFELPLSHVFDNCVRLMHDDDVYVQKGCGWLLKVTGEAHPDEVAAFLRTWRADLRRDTYRYAVEKLDPRTRAELMALGREAGR